MEEGGGGMTPPSEGGSTTGEVAEQTPADGDDQDGTGNGQGDGQNLADSGLHLISGGGQSRDQGGDSRGSFHSVLLSYQLAIQRKAADISLFIKSVETPVTRPSTKPNIMMV